MDLEQLKAQWKSVSFETDNIDEANRELMRQIAMRHATSVRQRLARLHKRTAIIGLILPLIAPQLYTILDLPIWLCTLYGAMGLFMGGLNLAFVKYILGKDYTSLPTIEACAHAIKIKVWRLRLLIVGFICLVLVLLPMLILIYNQAEFEVFIGGIIGLVVGLTIGLTRCYKGYKLTKQLNEILKDAVE